MEMEFHWKWKSELGWVNPAWTSGEFEFRPAAQAGNQQIYLLCSLPEPLAPIRN